jgi:V8-like Glu-specific endopeptidase
VPPEQKNAWGDPSFTGLESPFLSQEAFAGQGEVDWGSRLAALEAESPFLGHFELERLGALELEEDDSLTEKPCTGIIGPDNRIRVRQALDIPYRWVCQISARRRKGGALRKFGPVGTGILISPRFVLTAAHLLHGSEKDARGQWVDIEAEYVVVTPARNQNSPSGNDQPFGQFEARGWRLPAKYRPRSADAWKYDYAVIELKEPAGAKRAQVLGDKMLCFWGSRECGGNTQLEVLGTRELAGKTAYTAGYPADLGKGTRLYSTSGMLSSLDILGRHGIMNYDADGCPGQSGSPIWIERDGKQYLVGIFTKVGTGYDAVTGTVLLNSAVRITQEVFEQISRWFESVLETPWLGARELADKESSEETLPLNEGVELPVQQTLDAGPRATCHDDSAAIQFESFSQFEPEQLEPEQLEPEQLEPEQLEPEQLELLSQSGPSPLEVEANAEFREELQAFGPEFQQEPPKDEEPARPPFPARLQSPWLWHEDVSLRHAFQDALRGVEDPDRKRAYDAQGALPDASKIPIVIVALGPGGRPSFAGQNLTHMYYSGSLLKVAAMYGAFQLRKAVADFANTLPSGLAQDQVLKQFSRAFDAKILASAPTLPARNRALPKYADVLKVVPHGAHYQVEFLNLGDHSRRDFDFHLHQMVEQSHNPSAGVCVQGLGYSWINGALRAADLFGEDRKEPRDSLDRFRGIWLAGDYLLPSRVIQAEHKKFLKNQEQAGQGVAPDHRTRFDPEAEEEFELGISGLAEVRIPSVNDGPSKQAASCVDLANLMVQVARAKLIEGDPDGNTRIGSMLSNAVAMSIIGRFAPSARFKVLQSKIGFGQLGNWGSCVADNSGHTSGCVLSEALVIEETAAPKRQFVVVFQDIRDPSKHGNQDLLRVRDIVELTIAKF